MLRSITNPLKQLLRSNNHRTMSAASISTSDLVIAEEVNGKGVITLNRPKALNAANTEMVEQLAACLKKWATTKSMIIIKGAGGKAFCAGGDVRTLVEGDTPVLGKQFFRTEYTMNYIIGTLQIPYIAFIDGITMGGGVGLSVHGKYRIATERTLFAMPETAIGLFPDVGGSYFLPRLQGKLGAYLGLTGFRLKGADVLHAGIATHFCASERLPELEKSLLDVSSNNDVDGVLKKYCPKPDSEFCLKPHLEQINQCFGVQSVEEILQQLERDNSEWANKTIKTLRTVSPTSLKVTLHELALGAKMSLGECLQMEYRLGTHFCEDSDFHEGVRALLITKENNPKWNPARIEDVTQERVLSFFRPLSDNDELPINVKLPSKL